MWLRYGTLHFGFRNPNMEPGRQRPGYAPTQYDEGGDFWSARVFKKGGRLHSANMLAETRLLDAPQGDCVIRLVRTKDRVRFRLDDQLLLDIRVAGSTEPQTVGFYFPDLRTVSLSDVRVNIGPTTVNAESTAVRFVPMRVNHVGYRTQ